MIEKSLCEISNPKQWKTISTDMLKDEGYPVYGANGVIGYYSEYNHEEKTLLITCRGATCGSLNICDPYSYVNGNAMALDNLIEEINIHYLYYYLLNRGLNDAITGTAQPQIVRQSLQKVVIKYPELEVQHQIVNRLNQVANLINKRKKQLEKLDELVKSRFIEMFGDPNSNEKGWTVSTLDEYMTLLTDFSANGSYELLDSNVVMYDEPNYAVMVRTTDLEAGNLTDGVKYIDRTAYELLSKSKLYGGELIMNKIGSAGKIYIMPQIDKPASLGRNAFMFRFDDRINMVYLYALLSSDYGTKEIQQYVRGAVTKTITKESTRSIRVIVPPIELQEQYATFVKQVDKSKFEIKQSLEKLELLKKSLMQKYFG